MTIGNAGRDLVVYCGILPVLEFIMTSRRIVKDGNKQRGVIIAATVLITLSAAKIGYELSAKEQSYYDMLEVLPGTTGPDLKKGYKRASLKVCLHVWILHSRPSAADRL